MTESEAHKHFAIGYHGKTWELLDKPHRTADDDEMLVCVAHASLAHWRAVGTGLHHQRGVWFLSRVYAVLGDTSSSLRHARRCWELTQEHRSLMADFDLAFAHEALARAGALAGDRTVAARELGLAREAGEVIADPEDRKVFFDSLRGGNWNGLQVP